MATPRTNLAPPRTEILAQFALFRSTLDDVNDRRERLVKISRDITIASKRAIFHLHRALTSVEDDDAIAGEEKREKLDEGAVEEGGKLLEGIDVLWEKVGKELEGQDFWRHAPTM